MTKSSPNPATAAASGAAGFCTSCGALLRPHIAFCTRCGHRVGGPPSPAANGAMTSAGPRKLAWAATGGAILMFAGTASEMAALFGTPVMGFVVAEAWCLVGIAASMLGGLLCGYGLVRRKPVSTGKG